MMAVKVLCAGGVCDEQVEENIPLFSCVRFNIYRIWLSDGRHRTSSRQPKNDDFTCSGCTTAFYD